MIELGHHGSIGTSCIKVQVPEDAERQEFPHPRREGYVWVCV